MNDQENAEPDVLLGLQAGNVGHTSASGRAAVGPLIRQDHIALKYLDLARAEILDRMKQSNQTLIVYLGGVSAIVGWVYELTKADHVPLSVVVFPVGAGLAFLSFAASWIMFHNERMVNALARYQKQVLAPYLKLVAPSLDPWECSEALHDTDDALPTAMTMLVQGILILSPNLGSIVGVFWISQNRWSTFSVFQLVCFAIIFVLTLFTVLLSFAMVFHRRKLRKGR